VGALWADIDSLAVLRHPSDKKENFI
jgi:hypothetical protein